MHYVEVGKEDWFDRSGSYDGRFAQFYDAIKRKYPQLKVISSWGYEQAPNSWVKSRTPDLVDEKVEIALFFEDLFKVNRVDVVVLPDAPVFLVLEIVSGEILYAQDDTYEAEYQLYIMKMAADLLPYEREKQKMIMGA